MIKSFVAALALLGLAACANELTPEQKSIQRVNWVKTAQAAVPACIAAAEGRPGNYSVFRALGYKHINPLGDRKRNVFDSPQLTALNLRADSYEFTEQKGCSATYPFEHNAIGEIVATWLAALRQHGHEVVQIGTGKYAFMASGKTYVLSAYQQTRTGRYSEPSSSITILKSP